MTTPTTRPSRLCEVPPAHCAETFAIANPAYARNGERGSTQAMPANAPIRAERGKRESFMRDTATSWRLTDRASAASEEAKPTNESAARAC